MSLRSRAFPWFGTLGSRSNPGLPALLVAGAQAAARPVFVVDPIWNELFETHARPRGIDFVLTTISAEDFE